MRVAVPVYGNQVSTVFDFANRLSVFEIRGKRVENRSDADIGDALIPQKAYRLVDLGVRVLICGAVSRELASMVIHSGIEVIPYARGDVDDVIVAYTAGRLVDSRFAMPGCRSGERWGRRTRRRGRRPW